MNSRVEATLNKQVLIAALGLCVGSLGAHQYLQRVKQELAGGPQQAVLVLTRDMNAGDVVDDAALETTWVPEAYLDPRRIPAKERGQLVGVPLVTTVRAGEGLYWGDVAGGDSSRADLSSLVASGRRAYQLGPEANPFGALVRVGNRVDVLCGRADGAKTVLERALVLAVGDRLKNEDETQTKKSSGFRTTSGLSLSLLPEEAETLMKAERNCQLRIVVRGSDDIALRAAPEPPKEGTTKALVPTKTREIEHVR